MLIYIIKISKCIIIVNNNSEMVNQNIKNHNLLALRAIVFCLGCIVSVQSAKFTIQITGLQRQCFYQVLTQSQKYSLELIPKNQPKFQLQISQSHGGTWKSVYYKMASIGYERMEVHKLAAASTTYSFCIKNIQKEQLSISVKFTTGIELMQFELLPDKSDTENLDREIAWIENQKKNLYDTIRKVEQHKFNNMNSSSLLSTKMIIFAVIGLISIVVVNFLFFKEIKKTFKERKLI